MTINEIKVIYPWITEEEYVQHQNGGGWKHKTASVPDSVFIPSGASIGYGASRILCIQGTFHPLTTCVPTRDVQVGCKRHPIEWWLKCYQEVGTREGYTNDQIREYGIYLLAVKNWLDIYYPEKEN